MKKEKQLYKIGKTLGISETEVKAALLKNRNILAVGIVIGVATLFLNRFWFEPLHYTAASIRDFGFLVRFF